MWTPYSITCLSLITGGALLRLRAFKLLGENFSFQLAKPRKLVTTGMYAYVQHPSYTGALLLGVGNIAFLLRKDGVIGCWLPAWVAELPYLNEVGMVAMIALLLLGVGIRVADEEEMLRATFGKEWEDYHTRTKRFVPYLF